MAWDTLLRALSGDYTGPPVDNGFPQREFGQKIAMPAHQATPRGDEEPLPEDWNAYAFPAFRAGIVGSRARGYAAEAAADVPRRYAMLLRNARASNRAPVGQVMEAWTKMPSATRPPLTDALTRIWMSTPHGRSITENTRQNLLRTLMMDQRKRFSDATIGQGKRAWTLMSDPRSLLGVQDPVDAADWAAGMAAVEIARRRRDALEQEGQDARIP